MSGTLLLLGGMANNDRLWAKVIPLLHNAERVLVPDYSAQTSIAEMADAALAATDTSALSVVGFSMGGYVAQDMLRRHPERIARLTLLASQAGAADEPTRNVMAKTAAAAEKNFEAVLARMLPNAIHAARVQDGQLCADVMTMFREVGQAAFVRQCHAVACRADDRETLASYGGQTLIACGRQDQVCPPARSEELLRLIGGSAIEWFDDCGHLAPMERPAEVAAVLNSWLHADNSKGTRA